MKPNPFMRMRPRIGDKWSFKRFFDKRRKNRIVESIIFGWLRDGPRRHKTVWIKWRGKIEPQTIRLRSLLLLYGGYRISTETERKPVVLFVSEPVTRKGQLHGYQNN